MRIPEITHIKVNQDDIFDFVVGKSQYDPVEKCIDASRYSTYRSFIYDFKNSETLDQSSIYRLFWREIRLLKKRSFKMGGEEIVRICEELKEISPKELYL
tara:strand:+ start:188 stop:487 length:300 start_codon:yes stop_codon:yes gene_type:complete